MPTPGGRASGWSRPDASNRPRPIALVGAARSNRGFIRDYASAVKTEPVLVSGAEGQEILGAVGKVRPAIKAFLVDYSNRLVK